jgi:MFS family permease
MLSPIKDPMSSAPEESDSTTTAAIAPTKGSLLVLFLVVFIDLLGFGMVMPLLPNYGKQYLADMTPATKGLILGLLMSSFSLMQFIFAPLWGKLSDRIGRRPVLMIGLLGSVFSYSLFAVASLSNSLLLLFVSRIGAGIAGATISTAQAYIADCTTLKGRAKGMAIIGAAFGLGFTFGPLFGYFAVTSEDANPGPGPGYAAAGLSVAALVLAFFVLKESLSPEQRAQHAQRERGWWDGAAWKAAFTTPSMPGLLLATFICVFAFANFESTLSLLLKGDPTRLETDAGFGFTWHQLLLTFSYIGFSLLIAQGGIVRRLSGKVPETTLIIIGCIFQVIGFALMITAIQLVNTVILFAGLTCVVMGFSCVTPSLNSLISRRSDPAKQGQILGISQSVNSLARILGPIIGNVLLQRHLTAPYVCAVTLMIVGCVAVLMSAKRGSDWSAESTKT